MSRRKINSWLLFFFFFFPCATQRRDFRASRRGGTWPPRCLQRNIPHIHPLCFAVWKCPHESSSVLRDEAVTSTLPLFVFLFFFSLSVSPFSLTWLPIRQRAGVIMVIWGDLLGKFCSSVLAISTKDPRVSREEGGGTFALTVRPCCCIFTLFTALTAALNRVAPRDDVSLFMSVH